MLELAREARGLTQTKLSGMLGISQAQYSKIEQGLKSADRDLVTKISRALEFPVKFFEQDNRVYVPGIGFDRNRKSLGVKKRKEIDAQVNIQKMHIQTLLNAIDLESEKVPRLDTLDDPLSPEEPEIVANAVRQFYRLPRGPIENLTRVLEGSGIIVVHTDFGTPEQDGMTFQAPEVPPIIFVNKDLPPDRLRFTIAHELGHIVMHEFPTEDSEDQANRFASELLLPSDDAREDLLECNIGRMPLESLQGLKYKWGVSFQTLVRKALDLKLITKKQRQTFYVQMSRNGYSLKSEPDCGLKKETPTLLKDLFEVYRRHLDYSITDLSRVMNIYEDELVQLYGIQDERPKMRLVTKG